MKRSNYQGMVVFFATATSLLTVGLIVASAARKHQFERGVQACVTAISMRNPLLEARADVQRGERQFYFDFSSEWDMQGTADGVVLQRNSSGRMSKGCTRSVSGEWRDLPFQMVRRYGWVRRGDPYNGRVDPFYSPRTACGVAYFEYIRTYNAEMARISPQSIKDYCR